MTTQQALRQSLQNRRNKLAGDAAELTALRYIASLRLPVAHLETPWRVQRVGRRIVNATQMRPVLADLVSCLPDGRMIIVEVKREESDRLNWSRIKPHQRDNLDKWSKAGALCLLAWVRPGHGVLLLPWGSAPGWGNHHALPWESAQAVAWHPSQSLSAIKVNA